MYRFIPRSLRQGVGGVALLLFVLLGGISTLNAQYASGDYGSWLSGNWTTPSTWRVYNGTDWATSPFATSYPTFGVNVYILSGRTVTANGSGPYSVGNLTVEPNAKLWTANNATNVYITINGATFRCDGQIGDGANFDGISFNIDGSNVLLNGSGQFDASRIRKNSAINPTTNFTIARDVNLRFNIGTTTQLYNEAPSSWFHVTISAGVTVSLTGTGGQGNVSIDGLSGTGIGERGGILTVNGNLLVSGTLFLTTNNTSTAFFCRVVIGNTGYLRCSDINAAASGGGTNELQIAAGGILEITGTPFAWTNFSTTNNAYNLNATSRVIYSGAGTQNVEAITTPAATPGYGHLTIRGTGNKHLTGGVVVKGNLEILDTDGTPELDVTAANHQVTVSGNWTNFGPGGFNERTGLVIFNQGNVQTLSTGGAGERFHDWRIAKSGGNYVFLAANVTVANVFTLGGTATARLDLNGNRLSLLNPSPGALVPGLFGSARHIVSERTDNSSRVEWHIGTTPGAYLVPFGMFTGATFRSIPFTFQLTAGNAGVVTMATYGTPPNNLPLPITPTLVTNLNTPSGVNNWAATVDRFWQVDVTGTPTAGLTFTYAITELPGAPFNVSAGLRAQRWDSILDGWQVPLPGQVATTYYATVNGVTSFGPWTLAALSSPLPITLVEFDAKPNGTVVDLFWSTANERDNDYFTVLRSADGRSFEEVLRMDGAGHSQSLLNYSAVDRSPLNGISYYKLRQTDRDGTSWDSDLVAVHFGGAGPVLVAYPNPADDVLWVQGLQEGSNTLRIWDATGREVWSSDTGNDLGQLAIPVHQLASGLYTLVEEGAAGRRSLQFARQ